MGLDMFLRKRTRATEEVAYWRKANEIHAWFEKKFQQNGLADEHGIENCREYEVSEEDLKELRDVCQKVIDNSKLVQKKIKNGESLNKRTNKWEPNYTIGEAIENTKLAKELLPTQDGFFFGSTEYDQWYIEDLRNTIEQIDRILETTDFEKDEIVYSAWW